MSRDSQRSALYAWEHSVLQAFPALSRRLSLPECRAYLTRAWHDYRLVRARLRWLNQPNPNNPPPSTLCSYLRGDSIAMSASRLRAPIAPAPPLAGRPVRRDRHPITTPIALRNCKTPTQSGRKPTSSASRAPMTATGPEAGNAPAGLIFHGGARKGTLGRASMKSGNARVVKRENPHGFRSRGPSAERQARKLARQVGKPGIV